MLHKQKGFVAIRLVLLFLGFSFVLSSLAVPSTRSLKPTEENPSSSSSSVQDLLTQEAMDLNSGEQEVDLVEGYADINGRMDLEKTDYPGTGANNHHDPKTPGRS